MPRVEADTIAEHRRRVLERMYAAFEGLVYERGYDAVTLAEIAQATPLARTAMYNYFRDKEALLLAYTTHEMDEFFSDLRAELFAVDDPLDKLAIYVRAQVTYVATHHLPPGPALRSVLTTQGYEQIREHTVALEDTLAAILAEAATEGLIPAQHAEDDHTVRLVLACLASSQLSGLAGADLEDTIDRVQAFVRRAVGAAPARGA